MWWDFQRATSNLACYPGSREWCGSRDQMSEPENSVTLYYLPQHNPLGIKQIPGSWFYRKALNLIFPCSHNIDYIFNTLQGFSINFLRPYNTYLLISWRRSYFKFWVFLKHRFFSHRGVYCAICSSMYFGLRSDQYLII